MVGGFDISVLMYSRADGRLACICGKLRLYHLQSSSDKLFQTTILKYVHAAFTPYTKFSKSKLQSLRFLSSNSRIYYCLQLKLNKEGIELSR